MSVEEIGGVIPVAFFIAPNELKEAWFFFLRCIKHLVVGHDHHETICLIFDRGSGIIAAVEDEDNGWRPPFAVHRFCIRHVASNLNKEIKNQHVKSLVDTAAHQPKPRKFEKYMEMVRQQSEEAIEWFNRTDRHGNLVLPKEQWTLAFDGFYRFGHMTSNIVESYNSVLKGARDYQYVCW